MSTHDRHKAAARAQTDWRATFVFHLVNDGRIALPNGTPEPSPQPIHERQTFVSRMSPRRGRIWEDCCGLVWNRNWLK